MIRSVLSLFSNTIRPRRVSFFSPPLCLNLIRVQKTEKSAAMLVRARKKRQKETESNEWKSSASNYDEPQLKIPPTLLWATGSTTTSYTILTFIKLIQLYCIVSGYDCHSFSAAIKSWTIRSCDLWLLSLGWEPHRSSNVNLRYLNLLTNIKQELNAG